MSKTRGIVPEPACAPDGTAPPCTWVTDAKGRRAAYYTCKFCMLCIQHCISSPSQTRLTAGSQHTHHLLDCWVQARISLHSMATSVSTDRKIHRPVLVDNLEKHHGVLQSFMLHLACAFSALSSQQLFSASITHFVTASKQCWWIYTCLSAQEPYKMPSISHRTVDSKHGGTHS